MCVCRLCCRYYRVNLLLKIIVITFSKGIILKKTGYHQLPNFRKKIRIDGIKVCQEPNEPVFWNLDIEKTSLKPQGFPWHTFYTVLTFKVCRKYSKSYSTFCKALDIFQIHLNGTSSTWLLLILGNIALKFLIKNTEKPSSEGVLWKRFS